MVSSIHAIALLLDEAFCSTIISFDQRLALATPPSHDLDGVG